MKDANATKITNIKVKKALLISGLIGGILLMIGFTYAWMTLSLRGTKKVSIKAGPLQVYIDKENADLTLDNAVPQIDDIGLQGKAYTFNLVNETLGPVDYKIYLDDNTEAKNECTQKNSKTCELMDVKNVRFEFIEDRPKLANQDKAYQWREVQNLDQKENRLLMEGTIPAQTTYNYSLKLWIDIDATEEIIGKYFFGKIRVYAEQRTDNENPDPPTPPVTGPATDDSGASAPTLGNLIPVVFDNSAKIWKKANIGTKGEWYNYDEQRWPNAVVVSPTNYTNTYKDAAAGTEVKMNDILQMYVWIPRYSYTIYNTYGVGGSSKTSPGQIDVKFVDTETKDKGTAKYTSSGNPDNWYTPDAFTLGTQELSGLWVGKFEAGYSGAGSTTAAEKNTNTESSKVIIKPNVYSWRNITVSNIYKTVKGITNEQTTFGLSSDTYDSHAMKNSEWGAVAYLTQSKYGKYGNNQYTGANKEVYINNYYVSSSERYKTGCSGMAPGASTSSTCTPYDDLTDQGSGKGLKGPGASTTGNIYGIYDMSGGAYEYVMGNLNKATSSSGFTSSDKWTTDEAKYFNFYTSTTSTNNEYKSHAIGETENWYGDYHYMVSSSYPWFVRGGYYNGGGYAGVFHYSSNTGNYSSNSFNSFRVVLTLKETA